MVLSNQLEWIPKRDQVKIQKKNPAGNQVETLKRGIEICILVVY
jgi:hypothetical protein